MQYSIVFAALASVAAAGKYEYSYTTPSYETTTSCSYETSPAASTYAVSTSPAAASYSVYSYETPSVYSYTTPEASVVPSYTAPASYGYTSPAVSVASYSVETVPAASTYVYTSPAAETTPAASYSVVAVTTCVPTTIYQTVPLAATSAPVVAPSYPVGTAPAASTYGTGAAPSATTISYPTTSPITPATGAASSFSGNMMAAGAAAFLAVLFI